MEKMNTLWGSTIKKVLLCIYYMSVQYMCVADVGSGHHSSGRSLVMCSKLETCW